MEFMLTRPALMLQALPLAVTIITIALACLPAMSWSDSCVTSAAGADPSFSNTELLDWIRQTWNQVFTVDSNTSLVTVTVWRPARNDSMETPMKLYVLDVDSLGRPDPKRILLDGPDIVVPGGDGIHPIQ